MHGTFHALARAGLRSMALAALIAGTGALAQARGADAPAGTQRPGTVDTTTSNDYGNDDNRGRTGHVPEAATRDTSAGGAAAVKKSDAHLDYGGAADAGVGHRHRPGSTPATPDAGTGGSRP